MELSPATPPTTQTAAVNSTKPVNRTLSYQENLPKLPIPPLEDTCKRYLRALEALQDEKEHEATKAAVKEFLHTDGPQLHEMLQEYAQDKDSYIEEFW
jgi:carnitine O-acetyltransferase